MSTLNQNSFDEVVIQPASLEDILPDHKEYLNWLKTNRGEEVEKFHLDGLQDILTRIKVGSTVQIPMKQIGNIRISLFTYASPIRPEPSDPINLIFTNNAKFDSVSDYFENKIFPPWLDVGSCASPQWVRVENPANSGNSQWIKTGATKAVGGCTFIRNHMRVFDIGYDSSSQGMGNCSIVGVHYEKWEIQKFNHVIQDWNRSREFVENLFMDLLKPAKTLSPLIMQEPKNIQNVPYDGFASMIQLP